MSLNLSSDEVFLTTEEVLEYLQVNLRTVYRLIKAGKIPAVRVGRQWRFRKRDIDAWLDRQGPGGVQALAASLDAAPTGELTFLATQAGRPFTAAGFGNWFRDRCNEAGLPQCSAHGLRKAAAARCAEGGFLAVRLDPGDQPLEIVRGN